MAFFLSGDINFNPGLVTKHQLNDPKFEAFNSLNININSLLPKIDELHNIVVKCSMLR